MVKSMWFNALFMAVVSVGVTVFGNSGTASAQFPEAKKPLSVEDEFVLGTVATGQSDSRAKKPPSIEDTLREVKRRADDADRMHAEQRKEIGILRADLQRANKALETVNNRLDQIVAQAAFDQVPIGAM